jgi:Flp pilus assembly protein TadG
LRRRALDQQGSSMVETAVCILVMLTLIFAVIESCWAVYTFHYIGNASHEAARYAIVRGGTWGASCDGSGNAGSGYSSSMCTASSTDIANYVANRGFPGIRLTSSNVCVAYYSSVPSSASTSCTASSGTLANAAGDVVQVTVSYPFKLNLPLMPAYTWNLSSTSQMVIAQ